jgi:hypothetical protein
MKMRGADHAKIATSSRKACNSPGKVFAKTSALKKLFFTASHPGAKGINMIIAASTPKVDKAAITFDRRLTFDS